MSLEIGSAMYINRVVRVGMSPGYAEYDKL